MSISWKKAVKIVIFTNNVFLNLFGRLSSHQKNILPHVVGGCPGAVSQRKPPVSEARFFKPAKTHSIIKPKNSIKWVGIPLSIRPTFKNSLLKQQTWDGLEL